MGYIVLTQTENEIIHRVCIYKYHIAKSCQIVENITNVDRPTSCSNHYPNE